VKWLKLREQVLNEQPLCADCLKEHHYGIATEVHHKVKHNGEAGKFFDRYNLEGLCATHHGVHTGRGE
jgi:5-methylcytosine-specific restriction protein A